jgi:hypothetical protein
MAEPNIWWKWSRPTFVYVDLWISIFIHGLNKVLEILAAPITLQDMELIVVRFSVTSVGKIQGLGSESCSCQFGERNRVPRNWQLLQISLILRRSRTGTVWFYTSTSNKRAARPKLNTKSLTRDLKLMYSRFTLVRISINL